MRQPLRFLAYSCWLDVRDISGFFRHDWSFLGLSGVFHGLLLGGYRLIDRRATKMQTVVRGYGSKSFKEMFRVLKSFHTHCHSISVEV